MKRLKKLLQLANDLTDSSVKTAESLDMLEKGQIRVRTDFSFEEKAMKTVKQLTGYLVRALIIVALLIGSSLLCTASPSSCTGTSRKTNDKGGQL